MDTILPEVHGIDKGIDPNLRPERSKFYKANDSIPNTYIT